MHKPAHQRWSEWECISEIRENGGPGGPAEFQENQQLNPVWDEDPIL